MTASDRHKLPLVYACSGCSNVAQLANHIAVRLDREGDAEMSCISGVGGDVPSLVRLARSGRPIVAIDGCPLACVRHCLQRHDVEPTQYHALHGYGLRKRQHEDFSPEEAQTLLAHIRAQVRALHGTATAVAVNGPAV